MSESPQSITMQPWQGFRPSTSVRVPGSKSLTNRALIVSALAVGKSKLQGVLDSEDTRVMVESLRRLGFVLEQNTAERTIEVQGRGGKIPVPSADLYVENSGTSLRFLTALVALGHGQYRLDGNARMRERPVADLLSGLNSLGAIARSEADNGCPPVVVDAHGLDGGYAFVKGNVSSQYLSALLMVLPLARDITSVEVDGVLVSKPYIDMTLQVMEWFGALPPVVRRAFRVFAL